MRMISQLQMPLSITSVLSLREIINRNLLPFVNEKEEIFDTFKSAALQGIWSYDRVTLGSY